MLTKKFIHNVFLTLLLVNVALPGTLVQGMGSAEKITICHATSSETNPYVVISVSENATDGEGKNDHSHHEDDIIPISDLNGDGVINVGDCGFTEDPEDPEEPENTPPTITLLGDNPLGLTAGDVFTDPGAIATDEEDGELDVIVTGNVDANTPGTYELTYSATDSEGATAEVVRTVNVIPSVEENTPPVITLLGDAEINLIVGDDFEDPGATAFDEEDGIVDVIVGGDEVSTSTPGIYTITYNAVDSEGAEAEEVTRKVNVSLPEDDENPEINTPPIITLQGTNPIELILGDSFEDPGATAFDEEDGTVDVIVGGDEVSTSTPGIYTITYNAVDSEGAEAEEVTRKVIVAEAEEEPEDETPPVNAGGGGSALPECNDGIDNDGDTLIDYPEPGCDSLEDDDESGGVVTNGGGGNGPVVPIGANAPQIPFQGSNFQGEVLGEFTSCGKYLNEYIRFGEDNNPFEVRKLQRFLNEYEGETLEVTGVYNTATLEAVNRFQVKYAGEVLAPWLPYGHENMETPTGYVYKTTQRWINMIVCESLNLAIPDLNEDGAKWGITYDTDAELMQAQLLALLAEHQRMMHKFERVSP